MSLKHRALPEQRRGKLKTLLSQNRGLRFIEAHNGLSAIAASTTSFMPSNGTKLEFNGKIPKSRVLSWCIMKSLRGC